MGNANTQFAELVATLCTVAAKDRKLVISTGERDVLLCQKGCSREFLDIFH